MDTSNLLPADTYVVVNNTIMEDANRKLLTLLYQPIIGSLPINLYFILWTSLDKTEIMSTSFNHHHLMSVTGEKISNILEARKKLEAIGLIKTYFKEGEVNTFVYELYSPLSAAEVFKHPILNITLYNAIGKKEYDRLVDLFKMPIINLSEFTNITSKFSDVYESISYKDYYINPDNLKQKKKNKIIIDQEFDFDVLISSLPKKIKEEKFFTAQNKELITTMSYMYSIDELKMTRILHNSINEFGMLDKTAFRKNCRNFYQFEAGSELPNIIHRAQPDKYRTRARGTDNRSRMINTFETTTPYDFLKYKNGNINPSKRDLTLIEALIVDFELLPGVVNVLIDYVLKINNNKLTKNFVEVIAGQWKRNKIATVKDAMELAEKEHKEFNDRKTKSKYTKTVKEEAVPEWFDKEAAKAEVNKEEEDEMRDLLSSFK